METIDLQIQLAEAQAAIHVPGQWRCAKCGFELTKSIIAVRSGNIVPDLAQAETCPNDGEPMQRCTWKGDAMRLSDRCVSMMQRERSLSEKFEARAKHCRFRETHADLYRSKEQGASAAALYWRGRAEAWEVAALNLQQSNRPI